jgi:hypothetical protein
MARILHNALEANGVICTHAALAGAESRETVNLAMCLITLPYFCERWEGGDGLPGLMLWGEACTGKSHLFKSAPVYAKVAQDAQGVSRYKRTGVQRAYLLDDIKASFLNENTNMGTLRQLLLGDTVTVKVMGDTQDIQGWVVATSNEEPSYLSDTPPADVTNWTVQCKAWKRRFITVHMTEPLDIDPVPVNWHHASAREAAIACFMASVDQVPPLAKTPLSVYKEHIVNQLAEDWDEPFCEFGEEEVQWIDANIPQWEAPDALARMMKKAKKDGNI